MFKFKDRELCKGLALQYYINDRNYDKMIYIGDGSNDLCPLFNLGSNDLGTIHN